MTDDERDRVIRKAREDANLENRVKNLEDEVSDLRSMMAWGVRAIWGAAAYLLVELWKFIAQGGIMK